MTQLLGLGKRDDAVPSDAPIAGESLSEVRWRAATSRCPSNVERYLRCKDCGVNRRSARPLTGTHTNFVKRDERPAQYIVVRCDDRLIIRHKVSLLICKLDANRCDISRCVKIDLHNQAPVQEAFAKDFWYNEIGKEYCASSCSMDREATLNQMFCLMDGELGRGAVLGEAIAPR